MLLNISKLLTGDLLKILCDMGHGDEVVIADANFPAATLARRLVRLPGLDGVAMLRAILPLFPLDSGYCVPAALMELTDGDRAKGMPTPSIWAEYQSALDAAHGSPVELARIERFAFYERARSAYAIIQTGEERQYGNLILTKGVVL